VRVGLDGSEEEGIKAKEAGTKRPRPTVLGTTHAIASRASEAIAGGRRGV